MLQVGGSVHFDSISTNKERLTNTFPGYHSGYHNLFRKFVSFAVQAFRLHIFSGTIEIHSIVLAISWYLKGKSFSSWNTSRGKEWMDKRWRSFPAGSALLLRHAEFICGVSKRLQQWRFFFLTKRWTDLLIDIQGAICLMESCAPGSSSWKQTSSSKIDAFSCCCGNGSAAFFTTLCRPSLLDFFWLSYKLPSGHIQNSDAPSRFCMRSIFIKIIFNDSLLFVG